MAPEVAAGQGFWGIHEVVGGDWGRGAATLFEVLDSEALGEHDGSPLKSHVIRQRNEMLLGHHQHELGVGVGHVGHGDTLADLRARYARPHGDHFTGRFAIQNVGRLVHQMIITPAAVHVGIVHANGAGAQQHRARQHFGAQHKTIKQHFRVARLIEAQGVHGSGNGNRQTWEIEKEGAAFGPLKRA